MNPPAPATEILFGMRGVEIAELSAARQSYFGSGLVSQRVSAEINRNCINFRRGVLKQTIDKWRKCRAFGENQQHAQQQKENHNGREPPAFALAQKLPKLLDDAEPVHFVRLFVSVSKRRSAIMALPSAVR